MKNIGKHCARRLTTSKNGDSHTRLFAKYFFQKVVLVVDIMVLEVHAGPTTVKTMKINILKPLCIMRTKKNKFKQGKQLVRFNLNDPGLHHFNFNHPDLHHFNFNYPDLHHFTFNDLDPHHSTVISMIRNYIILISMIRIYIILLSIIWIYIILIQ